MPRFKQQVVGVDQPQAGPAPQAGEAIGQHGPAGGPLPAQQRSGEGGQLRQGPAPGARHHGARGGGVERAGLGRQGWGWSQGRFSAGDVVFVSTLLSQLFRPLDLLGMVYRTIRQGVIDMGAMFDLIDTPYRDAWAILGISGDDAETESP